MNLNEFRSSFRLLAGPSCNSEAAMLIKETSFYEAVKTFSPFVFMEVVESELKNDLGLNVKMRAPAYYKEQCIKEKARQDLNKMDAKKDPEYGRRPEDIKAMHAFFELIAKNNDEKGKTKLDTQENVSNMARCFGLMELGIFKGMGVNVSNLER